MMKYSSLLHSGHMFGCPHQIFKLRKGNLLEYVREGNTLSKGKLQTLQKLKFISWSVILINMWSPFLTEKLFFGKLSLRKRFIKGSFQLVF